MTTTKDWEAEFDNGVALKIGKAGKSEGVVNVRREIKAFMRSLLLAQKNELKGVVEGMKAKGDELPEGAETYNKILDEVLAALDV